jgi:hypothetical protein
MSTIAEDDLRVVAGVDTHKEFHVVVVLDELGRKLDMATFAATPRGYRELTGWVCGFGEVLALGVEGSGSWGAGLCRHLRERGLNVIEVNQPDRHQRRRKGKSDPLDAEVAARAVLAGDATALPKSSDGPVEALRQIRVARAGAMKARTAAANQLHRVCDTAPDQIRSQLRGLTTRRLNFVGGPSNTASNGPLPDSTSSRPNAAIYAFWDDLIVDAPNASVRTTTGGVAPNRFFVIEWVNARFFFDDPAENIRRVSFEIVLFENGHIVLQYKDISTNSKDLRERGSSATVGIENQAGTAAVQRLFDQPLLDNGLGIEFAPASK